MTNPMTKPIDVELARLAANTVKFLAVDAVEKANSGHPGMPMGAADVAVVVWGRYLRYDPSVPDWPDRDRFVLSAGHGCMLLYGLLHLAGCLPKVASHGRGTRSSHWPVCFRREIRATRRVSTSTTTTERPSTILQKRRSALPTAWPE